MYLDVDVLILPDKFDIKNTNFDSDIRYYLSTILFRVKGNTVDFIIKPLSRLCRTRPRFSAVHVDGQDGTSDAFGRRVRGRDTYRRRCIRISGGPRSR